MSAIDTVFRLLKSGDHVVAGENMYGGSYRLFSRVLEKFGLQFTYVDTSDVDAVRGAMRPNTRIVYLETPTNPMMTITDLAACAEVAHAAGALVVVDNTFCSPYLQRPIELGADIVVHSTTKFLNGHSDSVGGVVVSNSDEIARADRLPAERGRRDSLAVRFVARAARREDARRAHEAARGERHGDGELPRAITRR